MNDVVIARPVLVDVEKVSILTEKYEPLVLVCRDIKNKMLKDPYAGGMISADPEVFDAIRPTYLEWNRRFGMYTHRPRNPAQDLYSELMLCGKVVVRETTDEMMTRLTDRPRDSRRYTLPVVRLVPLKEGMTQ